MERDQYDRLISQYNRIYVNNMKKLLLVFSIALCTGYLSFAQSSSRLESSFHLGVDLQTKYVWRGMEMLTNDAAPVVFPQINYQNGGLYVYVMGASAFNG